MKKLQSMFVGIVIASAMISPLRVEANTIPVTGSAVATASSSNHDSSNLTLVEINSIKSWSELQDRIITIHTQEDDVMQTLINLLSNDNSSMIYHSQKYVKTGYGGIDSSLVNSVRLKEKMDAIINLYNKSSPLHVSCSIRNTNKYIGFDLESDNVFGLEHPCTNLGQTVLLKEGSTLWESPLADGTGKYTISDSDTSVTCTGVCYYTDTDRKEIEGIIRFPYWFNISVPIKTSKCRMLHCTKGTKDLGWVWAENVVYSK